MTKTKPYSAGIMIIFAIVCSWVIISNQKWRESIYRYDVLGYHLYLQATLIYHDPGKLSFLSQLNPTYDIIRMDSTKVYKAHRTANGNWLNK